MSWRAAGAPGFAARGSPWRWEWTPGRERRQHKLVDLAESVTAPNGSSSNAGKSISWTAQFAGSADDSDRRKRPWSLEKPFGTQRAPKREKVLREQARTEHTKEDNEIESRMSAAELHEILRKVVDNV